MGKSALNVRPFSRQCGAINFDKAGVVRASIQTQLPQPRGIQRPGSLLLRRFSQMRCDGGMLFYVCVHKLIQLKLFAEILIAHAGGNETAHPAQGDTFIEWAAEHNVLCIYTYWCFFVPEDIKGFA